MTDIIAPHLLAAAAGAAFGVLYLGLLWGAVRVLARRGGALTFALFGLGRAALLVAALAGALALGATASHIAAALAGFVALRVAATRAVEPRKTGATGWR